MTSDLDLLRQFARENSQDAFGEIVRRHLPLVYSAAVRQVRSPQLAEDVAQSVFADLACEARALKPDTVLSGWLYAVARRTAIDTVRKESRRQLREQIAMEMNNMNATADDWAQITPLLDDAMAALEETDRTAILLRYFENKSLRDVGESLQISDDAAQKRVSRAVERLREFFTKERVTMGAAAVVVLISANAVQAAPVGLAGTISTALAGTVAQTSAVITATKTIAMTTLQKSIVVAALAAAAGTGIYAAHENFALRGQIQSLQQQQAPLAGQIRQLQQERDDATNQLAALAAENTQFESSSNETELLKLRGEVTRLQNNSNDPASVVVKALADKVKRLIQRFQQTPGAIIPEMQYLTDNDWLQAANYNLETDLGYRRVMSWLRGTAENKFASMLLEALNKYMAANNSQFPTDLSQLQPYFASPVDPAILQRWEITSAQTVPNINIGSQRIITEIAPVDEVFDSRTVVGTIAYGNADFFEDAETQKMINNIYKAYEAANNGQTPANVSQLLPYATTPAQQTAVQNMILRQSP